jgi:hypothetical protein
MNDGPRGLIGDKGDEGARGPIIPPEEWAAIMSDVAKERPPAPRSRLSYQIPFAISALILLFNLVFHYFPIRNL